jgi:hypothetical protein
LRKQQGRVYAQSASPSSSQVLWLFAHLREYGGYLRLDMHAPVKVIRRLTDDLQIEEDCVLYLLCCGELFIAETGNILINVVECSKDIAQVRGITP